MKPFFYITKTLNKNLNILRTKRKIKKNHHFYVAKNWVRPESVSLTFVEKLLSGVKKIPKDERKMNVF